jgi:RNA-directed DNA polymerase
VRAIRRQRVNEGSLRRLMGKWRRAGVRDGGGLQHPETGVVQGGGISPGLANVMRQQVVEAWCAQEVQPRLQGSRFLPRCAADVVIGGERDADARRGRAVRPKRCARLGWRRHPEQTAGMAFSHPRARQGAAGGHGTGAVLGVTHSGAHSRRG